GEGIRRLEAEAGEGFPVERSAAKALREALALHVLHDQQVNASSLLDRMDGDDVRMVQGRSRPCLLKQPLPRPRVHPSRRRQGLERNRPPELQIACGVHLAHASGSDLLQNLVMKDSRADVEYLRARLVCLNSIFHVLVG